MCRIAFGETLRWHVGQVFGADIGDRLGGDQAGLPSMQPDAAGDEARQAQLATAVAAAKVSWFMFTDLSRMAAGQLPTLASRPAWLAEL